MNKKIKMFVLIMISLLLCGCSATANIKVNYDGSVEEKINVSDINSNIRYGNKSIEDSIQLYIDQNKTVLDFENYKRNIYEGKETSGAIISKNHKDICNFVNTTVFSKYLYDRIVCEEDDYYYIIKNIEKLKREENIYDTLTLPKDIKLKISLPVSAVEQNADEIEGNTYIWKYNKNTEENKSFYLKISKDALKKSEVEYKENLKQKENIKKIIIVGVVIIVIIALSILGSIFYRKYKLNKLEY